MVSSIFSSSQGEVGSGSSCLVVGLVAPFSSFLTVIDEKWRKGVRVAFRAQLSMASDLHDVMWAASDCSGLLGARLVTKDPRQTLHSTTIVFCSHCSALQGICEQRRS